MSLSSERGVESQSPGRLGLSRAFLLRERVMFGAAQTRWSWDLPPAVDGQVMFSRLWARAGGFCPRSVFRRVLNAVQVQMWAPQTAVRIQHTLTPGLWCFRWSRASDLTHGNHLHQTYAAYLFIVWCCRWAQARQTQHHTIEHKLVKHSFTWLNTNVNHNNAFLKVQKKKDLFKT